MEIELDLSHLLKLIYLGSCNYRLGRQMWLRVCMIVSGTALAACAAPHQIMDRSDFLAEATRSYAGETTERLIAAAQSVLRQSDPADFEFRDSVNGFTGLRRYVIYAVLAAARGREKWDFLIDQPTPGQLRASISVSEAGVASGGYSAQAYENRIASVPLYRLFWKRVDYVLDRRPDWVTCDQASEELQATNTNVTAALGGLCGPTSDGRNAEPPPVLPPLPRVAPLGPAAKPSARAKTG